MKRILELMRKYKNEGYGEMLERHKKIIDKYASPYPLPGPNNWLGRYEQIIARGKERERVIKQKKLEREKAKENAVVSTSNDNVDKPADATKINVNPDNNDPNSQVAKSGEIPNFKFFDDY